MCGVDVKHICRHVEVLRIRRFHHQGGYMLVDLRNIITAGYRFDLSLDDVEEFLKRLPSAMEGAPNADIVRHVFM